MDAKRLTSRGLTARLALTSLLALSLLALGAGGSASAASYSVYACVGPADEALPNSSWLTSVDTPSQTLAFLFGSNCGDLSVQADPFTDFAGGDGAQYVFDPPAGTTIAGYQLTRAAAVTYPKSASQPKLLSAGVRETTGSVVAQFDCDAVAADCDVPAGTITRSGLALTQLSAGVHCADVLNGCPAGSFTQLFSQLRDARVDVDDPAAPVIASVVGSLPGSNVAAGALNASVTATDVGGGVRAIDLSIDGAKNQSLGAGGSCGQPYTLRQPCPSGIVRTFTLDTANLATGGHTGSITAVDAAGNVSRSFDFTFTVASGGTSGGSGITPSNGSPAVEQPNARMEKPLISASSGKAVTVEGTLLTSAGVPVSGAVLDVTSLDLGVFDAKTKTIGTVTTTSSGRFSVRVKPDGAKRISVIFRPYPSSIGTAVTSTIVREQLSLSAKHSKSRVKPGGRLTISGRLSGAGAAADGAPVEIDVKIGSSWRAVGVVEARSSGRYSWVYRFTRVTTPTRFTFRAVVRKNRAWPWPTETSKSVKVLVAP